MRAFVAVEPPTEAIRALRGLERPAVRGFRWTPEGNWHVTLRFLGDIESADAVVAALDGADLGPPVQVRLGPDTRWLGRNVLVVPASGLDDLAERVRSATAELGAVDDRRPFDGHLTVGRRKRRGGRPPTGVPLDRTWTVEEIVLFSSTLDANGAVHRPIRRFPLTPRADAPAT